MSKAGAQKKALVRKKTSLSISKGFLAQEEIEEDVRSVESDEPQPCKSPECKHKIPHVHQLAQCAAHNFCPIQPFQVVADNADKMTLPLPITFQKEKEEKGIVPKYNFETEQEKYFGEYEKQIKDNREAYQLKDIGLKVVVTDYALAQWYAQSLRLDLKNIPGNQPAHLAGMRSDQFNKVQAFFKKMEQRKMPEREINESLKKQLGFIPSLADYPNPKCNAPATPSALDKLQMPTVSKLETASRVDTFALNETTSSAGTKGLALDPQATTEGDKPEAHEDSTPGRSELEDGYDWCYHVKKGTAPGEVQSPVKGGKKQQEELNRRRGIAMMRRLKVTMYPLEKDVVMFEEFLKHKQQGKGKSNKDRDREPNTRAKADDSVSQSSIDGADTAKNAIARQQTQTQGKQGGEVQVKARLRGGSSEDMRAKQLTNFISVNDGFEAIAEEVNTSAAQNADLVEDGVTQKEGGVSQSLKSGALAGSRIADRLKRTLNRGSNTTGQIRRKRDWEYNPYASEEIMHFKHLSRQEIKKAWDEVKQQNEQRKLQEAEKEAKELSSEAQPTRQRRNLSQGSLEAMDERAANTSNLSQKRKVSHPVGQFDISKRAKREQQFHQKMLAGFNVNVRQGRTYSQNFNKQISFDENRKGVQGTCVQYLQQFNDFKQFLADSGKNQRVQKTVIPKTSRGPFSQRPMTTSNQTIGSRQTSNEKAKIYQAIPLQTMKKPLTTADLVARLQEKRSASTHGLAGMKTRYASTVNTNVDKALSSLDPFQREARKKGQLHSKNDPHLTLIINRKHKDSRPAFQTSGFIDKKSTLTLHQGGANVGTNLFLASEPAQQAQQRSVDQDSKRSTYFSTTHQDSSVQKQARRRIKDMFGRSGENFMNLDLRNKKFEQFSGVTTQQQVAGDFELRGYNAELHTFQQKVASSGTFSQEGDYLRAMNQEFGKLTHDLNKMARTQKDDLLGERSEVARQRINQVSFIHQPSLEHELTREDATISEESPTTTYQNEQFASQLKMKVLSSTRSDLKGKGRARASLLERQKSIREEKSAAEEASVSNGGGLSARTKRGFSVPPEDYNFEVAEPKQYFQKELNIKLGLYEPEVIKGNHDKDIFKSAHFWLSKGYVIQSRAHAAGNRKNAHEADNVALDYYLSGVKIDPQHYGCVYNSGCCHFFTGKYQNARKWFHLTTRVNPRCPDGYYGKAISCLKLGLYEEALESVLQIDVLDESRHKMDGASDRTSNISTVAIQMQPSARFTQDQITFLHAVCCKILQQDGKAEELYKKLNAVIHRTQCKKMVLKTFAVILVPLQKNREVTEDNLQTFREQMNINDPTHLYDESVANNIAKLQTTQIEMSDKNRRLFFAKYLSIFPFFKRVPLQRLEEFYIHKIRIESINRFDLVSIPPANGIILVINGQIILREHALDNPGDFEIKYIAKAGHVLFAPELDMGTSNLPLVWPVVYSERAQIAYIDRATFDELWKDSRNRDVEVQFSQLNLHTFFKEMSRQTFYKIINEKSRLVSFRPGQLVLPIHHRSPWTNELFKKYLSKQMTVLEMENSSQLKLPMQNSSSLPGGSSRQSQLKMQQKEEQYKEYLQKKNYAAHGALVEGVKAGMLQSLISNLTAAEKAQEKVFAEEKKQKAAQDKTAQREKSRLAKNLLTQKMALGGELQPKKPDPLSPTFKSPKQQRKGRKEPTDYEKLANQIHTEPKLTDSGQIKKALERKKAIAHKKYQLLQQGIDLEAFDDEELAFGLDSGDEEWINKKINGFRPEKSFRRPIMLMYEGSARCVNNYFPEHKFVAKRLATGSILGESDAIGIIGLDYFGDIYAESKGLKCLVIDKPDLVLDRFEAKILREHLESSYAKLQSMLETRYQKLKSHQIKRQTIQARHADDGQIY